MRVHISQLKVSRYRGLAEFSLEDLGRVNLLVGANNSGKTSVLEALALSAAPLDPSEWMSTARRREPSPFPGARRTTIERLRWLFPQQPVEGPDSLYGGNIDISIGGTVPITRVFASYQELRSLLESGRGPSTEDNRNSMEDEELPERKGARIDVEIEPKQQALLRPIPNTKESFTWWEGERFVWPERGASLIRSYVITPYDHWFRFLPPRLYSDAQREGTADALLELLARIDPRVSGIEVLATRTEGSLPGNDAALYLRDKHAGLLPVEAFGDGMRRILLMALAVRRARGGILLIDEIETAIHFSALGYVFRWIVDSCAQNNVQLFATTHSLEALDAILAADTTPEEDVVAFRLEQQVGRAIVHRYGENLLRRLRVERGVEVR